MQTFKCLEFSLRVYVCTRMGTETHNIKTVLYSILKFQQSIRFMHILPHSATLLFKTQTMVHFHPKSHIQIQGAILMLGY